MANIILKNIKKTYEGGVTVIENLNLEIKDKEFVVLVGPSGCGKSTTLRMIAGLESITDGEMYMGGKLVNKVAPKDRDIAMVFQTYALYPHMNVYKNMAFGLMQRKVDKKNIDEKVMHAAKILDLEPYLKRKPKALSGGQRQRVALGRAMVRDPEIFLLDEPLSNLDAKLRTEMRSQISKLHKDLGTTFVYVTHDQTEAMTMADRIVVMKGGVVQQFDTPQALYDKPANMFVASFIGSPEMNLFPAKIQIDQKKTYVLLDDLKMELPEGLLKNHDLSAYDGKEIVLGIRPEDFYMENFVKESYPDAILRVEAELVENTGSEMNIYFKHETKKANKGMSIAKINSRDQIQIGDSIELVFDKNHIHLFDKDTEVSLFNEKEKKL
ncbi:ABC transporter ATP-binding protein [uncultured Dubosiella sp.]|uniref:ABC transporter ATP-binding protein n=1 Tax=uncultured Dubosiella sp. TaxID=1937011 RepID=UPI0025B2AB23|nr:sn-glycerol-3-phosphate ABC transporter ATP-binding protein UgpC [uncultured Dubosiella sp.]